MRVETSARQIQSGFTYVGLIVLVAIIGLVAASTLKMGALLQRRAAEQDLLEIGAAFTSAFNSYAEASGPEQRRSPTTLDQLLRDPRFPTTKRHLRTLYADPISGETKWGLVMGLDKLSIIGVYSLSNAKPIKQGNFAPGFEQFENKTHLSEWKFVGREARLLNQPAITPKPATLAPFPTFPTDAVKPGSQGSLFNLTQP